MTLLAMAFSWWIVGFTGALMPGPVTTLTVTETARRGFWAGPQVTFGHVILELAMVVGLLFGLGEVLKQNAVAGVVGVLGGLVLLWMGYGIIRAAWQNNLALELALQPATSSASSNPVIAGLVTSISNPYWLLWWSTVGAASFISFRSFGWPGVVAFYVGHTLADWVWGCAVAAFVSTGKHMMTDRVYRAILLVCGIFLLGLAIYFLASGVRFLTS